ncbi:MAG: cadherin-like domain-containing protein [Peptococcaceae bacterium]|nr:cadherin-like domain-containing protein [Candidatus Syntrophopropionicum ammoniitolerans]
MILTTGLKVSHANGLTRFDGIIPSLAGVKFDNTASYIAYYDSPICYLNIVIGNTKSVSSARMNSISLGNVLGVFSNPVETPNPDKPTIGVTIHDTDGALNSETDNLSKVKISGTTTAGTVQTVTVSVTDGVKTITTSTTVQDDGTYSVVMDLTTLQSGTITAEANVTNPLGTPADPAHDTSQLTNNLVTVTYDENGGDNGADPKTQKVNHNQPVDTLPTPPSKANHQFTGWNTQADGKGDTFDKTTTITGDIKVYAQYKINQYTVDFNSNGGSDVASITGIEKDTTITLPDNPTKKGYTFEGWYTDDGTFNEEFTDKTSVTGDTEVYAKWTKAVVPPENYTVTFEDHDGAVLKSETVAHGGSATAPAEPTRKGYIFSGWDVPFDNVTGDLTVTAQYKVIANNPPVITGGTTAEGDKNSIIKNTATAEDADGDELTFTKTSDPANGSVTVNPNGSYVYVPKPDFTGTDSFEITVSDGRGGTDTKTVTITVNDAGNIDLYGFITDKKSAEAVKNATVELIDYLTGTVLRTAQTGEDGGYSFPNIEGDLYTIRVTHNQYSDNMRQVSVKHSNVVDGKVREDFALSKYKITLVANPSSIVADGQEETILTARVLDEDNNPVVGVRVDFSAIGDMGYFYKGNQAQTNAAGLATIPYRSIKIEAIYSIAVPVTAKVEDPVREIYASDQIVVTFAPGKIRGIVTDNNNQPIAGAKVVVKHYDEYGKVDFLATYTTGADGSYAIAIPKGGEDYQVEITKPIEVSGGVVEKTFVQTSKAGTISGKGTEEFPSEKTITGVVGIITDDGQKTLLDNGENRLGIEVVDAGGNLVPGALASINPDGVFSVTGLEKDTSYTLALSYQFPDGSRIITKKVDVSISQDGEVSIGEILIDPYGTITDADTKQVIVGAEVKLYYYKDNQLVVLPLIPGFLPNDNKNPQISSSTGEYAYMVYPDTDYYLVATRDGYETYTSPKISVFKEIVKHDFEMRKKGSGSSGSGGGGGSASTSVDVAIALETEKHRIAVNDSAVFKLIYGNKSNTRATNVKLSVTIPQEFTILQAPGGAQSGNTITWTIGELPGKAVAEREFTLRANDIGEKASQSVTLNSLITSTSTLINTADDQSDLSVLIYQEGAEGEGLHKRYIKGYPDGLVKPDREITRAEIAAIFARLLELQSYATKDIHYNDVGDEHWAAGYIRAVSYKGLFTGYGNGCFQPDASITRAELATVVGNYLGIENQGNGKPVKTHFSDTNGHWGEYNIEQIFRHGIIKGYEDATFRPNNSMIRSEAMTMINRMLNRGPLTGVEQSFPDMPKSHWAFGEIEEAVRTHTYYYTSDGCEKMAQFIPEDLW